MAAMRRVPHRVLSAMTCRWVCRKLLPLQTGKRRSGFAAGTGGACDYEACASSRMSASFYVHCMSRLIPTLGDATYVGQIGVTSRR